MLLTWLAEIGTETVQAFLYQKVADGYSSDTLKNLKWGLSFCQVRVRQVNPVRAADLPPEGIKEEAKLPTGSELEHLIDHLSEPLSTAVWLAAVTCIVSYLLGAQQGKAMGLAIESLITD